MSKLETLVGKLISKAFPSYRVKTQHYVVYQNTRLLFDYLIPELKIALEVQGEQHFSFTSFYHDTEEDFKNQKFRDKLKTQWADENGYVLIAIDDIALKMKTAEFKKFILERL